MEREQTDCPGRETGGTRTRWKRQSVVSSRVLNRVSLGEREQVLTLVMPMKAEQLDTRFPWVSMAPLGFPEAHAHARTHAHAHTQTHTHRRTDTHTHTDTHTNPYPRH